MTKAELRTRIRQEAGDEERLSGTASGGSTTTIVSSVLSQPDNHWKKLKAFIKTTTDSNAPQGEGRTVSKNTQSTTTLTVELPFTAAIESGDTFGIAVFSDTRIDNIMSDTFTEFSEVKPNEFTETLIVTNGNKRFTPTSATAQGFRPDRIEFFDSNNQEHIRYNENGRREWWWDKTLDQIEWAWFWGEQKNLTLFATKHHTIPTADGDDITIDDEDVANFVKWASLKLMLSMTDSEIFDDFGNLQPKSITRGQVKIDYGDVRSTSGLRQVWREEINEIKSKYGMPLSLKMSDIPSGKTIDRKEDPDGTPMPQVFWELT